LASEDSRFLISIRREEKVFIASSMWIEDYFYLRKNGGKHVRNRTLLVI
jgi:hypothetical protein